MLSNQEHKFIKSKCSDQYQQASTIRSKCLFDADARQRGVDCYAKSAGNAERVQLPATTSHHREVVSRGGHHTFVRPSDGCADAEAPVAGPHPANACQPPSAPCGVGAGSTSWTAISDWQPLDGHALPTRRTSPASRRPPRMGTRHPIPLLPTGKPLRGTTPLMMMNTHWPAGPPAFCSRRASSGQWHAIVTGPYGPQSIYSGHTLSYNTGPNDNPACGFVSALSRSFC